jgi:hypothetical protein
MRNRNRILRVEIQHKLDESPDTSWMGEYSDTQTSSFSIDRAHRIDCDINTGKGELCDCGDERKPRRELRYFNPSFNYVNKNGFPVAELTPEDVRKYTLQDYERMEGLNAGNWNFMGVIAQAYVATPDTFGYTEQVIHSGGVWGIESDASKEYIKSEENQQLRELREILKEFGFSTRQISAAFKNVKR